MSDKSYSNFKQRRKMKRLRVLIACEESQAICNEFRRLGHIAFSCDLQPCSGGHPEWHIQGDCLPLLGMGWDLIVAHPPCTYLANSGLHWLAGPKGEERLDGLKQGAEFFLKFSNLSCAHVAIENPRGVMSKLYRKPDQIIHPWMWGDKFSKATCLWTKDLPKLVSSFTEKPSDLDSDWWRRTRNLPTDERRRERSKTFPGIARAIAEQWSAYILNQTNNQ